MHNPIDTPCLTHSSLCFTQVLIMVRWKTQATVRWQKTHFSDDVKSRILNGKIALNMILKTLTCYSVAKAQVDFTTHTA